MFAWRGRAFSSACRKQVLCRGANSRVGAVSDAYPEARLEPWIVQHGGKVSGVELCVVESAVGGLKQRDLRATETLEPGRLIISVPPICQLRYDDVEALSALQLLFDRCPRGSSNTAEGAWQFKQALTVRGNGRFTKPPIPHRFQSPPSMRSSCGTSLEAPIRFSSHTLPLCPAFLRACPHLASGCCCMTRRCRRCSTRLLSRGY